MKTKRTSSQKEPGRRAKGLPLAITALLVISGGCFLQALQGQDGGKPNRTEIFRVSRSTDVNAAETQETLLELYQVIAAEYNETVRKEQQSNPQLYKGDRVRVLRDLGSGGGGNLFLVAYNGGPVVFEVSGDASTFEVGALSPALAIGGEAGQHSVEITRTVKVKNPKQNEPQLETVEDTGGAVTFFGIAIPGTGGSSSGGGGGGAKKSGGSTTQEITEEKVMPKYTAAVSTERLDGGPPEMSKDLFVSQLKNGEIFTVGRPEQRRCQECRGFGRVATTKPVGFRDPDGKMDCPECQAKGKIDWEITYKVTW